jgi:hypothetical protein
MSLLPGLRDLRTPLAVGYLWLSFLWLLMRHEISEALASKGVIAEIAHIVGLAEPTVALAALSFFAYLVGAVALPLSIAIKNFMRWFTGLGTLDGRTEYRVRRFVTEQMSEFEATTHSWQEIVEILVTSAETWTERKMATEKPSTEKSIVSRILNNRLWEERDDLAVQLQLFEKQNLFQAYDRNRSESEFRAGVALPILALTIVISLGYSRWALLALPVPAFLLFQAMNRDTASNRILYRALTAKIIASNAIQDIRIRLGLRDEVVKEGNNT